MDTTDICYLSAVELRDKYQSLELSPVEATEAILNRIDRLNPLLNAFVTVTAERAFEDARKAERQYLESDTPPPLAGIQTSIKDLVPTSGIRTTRGSLLYKDWVPDFNPVFVQRLYDAGIVMLGKTNTPEGGWKGDSGNRVVGPTQNPWVNGRTAGGSSGGAAAAIATGMGSLAQGGDGAGSIRIPASFSGIYGLKPSFGRIPYPGSSPTHLAHTGPMTRTVADAALFLDVASGASNSDRYSLDTTGSFLERLRPEISGMKVAWSPDLGFAEVAPEIARITASAVETFTDLGCDVELATPHIDDPWPIEDLFFAAGQASGVARNFEEVRGLLDQGRVEIINRAWEWTAMEVMSAFSKRDALYDAFEAFMEPYEILITPCMPIPAFDAGKDFPEEINGKPMSYLSWTPFTYPFNLTGHPAASIPCGFDQDGLPVGLQIIGKWRDDQTVLNASAAFELARPWADNRPPVD